MEKKIISIVTLDPRAGRSYVADVEGLFGEYAKINLYNVRDGSAMGVLPWADLFVVSTDAYGSAEEVAAMSLWAVRLWLWRYPSGGANCGN